MIKPTSGKWNISLSPGATLDWLEEKRLRESLDKLVKEHRCISSIMITVDGTPPIDPKVKKCIDEVSEAMIKKEREAR